MDSLANKPEEKKAFFEWRLNPEHDEIPSYIWGKENGVSQRTVYKWEKQTKGTLDEFDEFISVLKKAALKGGNSRDRELYAKVKGWLIDRREEKHVIDFSAAEYIRIGNEIIGRLREDYRHSGGSCPVCGVSQVLCPPREDTEPEQQVDRDVAAVALST